MMAPDTERVPWGWLLVASVGGSVGGALVVRWLIPLFVTAFLKPPQQGLDFAYVGGRLLVVGISTAIGCFVGAGIAGSIGWGVGTHYPRAHPVILGWELWCAVGGGIGTVLLLIIALILQPQ